jgi:hypothetical protein
MASPSPSIPWSSIETAHINNGAKGLKDFIESWLINLPSNTVSNRVSDRVSEGVKERVVEEVLRAPASSTSPVPLPVHLLTIKAILDASNSAIKSGSVFNHVSLRQSSLNWLGNIAQDSSHSASLRGGVIAIFALIVKRFPKEVSKFGVIGQSLHYSFSDAAAGLGDPDLTVENLISSPCAMLLNQTVDVLTMAGDASLSWLQPVGRSVDSIGLILQYFSSLIVEPKSPVASLVNKIQIKVCKAFSMVVEIYMATPESSKSVSTFGEAISQAPCHVLRIVSDTVIIHDIFQSTYQSALDISRASSPWTIERAVQLVNNIRDAVSSQNQSKIEGEVVTYPYPSVIEIRRVESLLGLFCCVLDCHHDAMDSLKVNVESDNEISLNIATTAVALIDEVMTNLKSSLSKDAITSTTCGGSQKDLRAASSDTRKGCIAVAHSLFTAFPIWVVEDLHQDRPVASSQCWRLAVKLLSTPLLFGAAFGASAATGPDHQHYHNEFTHHILQYLSSALHNVSKYSYAVACDVLSAIEELIEKDCILIVHFRDDIPLRLLNAYLSSPKGLSPSSKTKKSESDNDNGNAYEWKLHVLSTLKSLFQFANRVEDCTGFSAEFVNRFISQVCCSELLILHGALGNMSPGHMAFFASLLSTDSYEDNMLESRASALVPWYNASRDAGFSLLTVPTVLETGNRAISKKEKCRKDCNRLVKKMLGSSEMSEPLVGLLHTLTLTLVAFMDVICQALRLNPTSTHGGLQLNEESSQGMCVLLCFINDISTRQLLFEDDGAQICGEMEVVSRYIAMESLRRRQENSQELDKPLVEHMLRIFVQMCFRTLNSNFQLGSSFGKIIYEIGYNELFRSVESLLSTKVKSDESINTITKLTSELSPTYELAVKNNKGDVVDADAHVKEVTGRIVSRLESIVAQA